MSSITTHFNWAKVNIRSTTLQKQIKKRKTVNTKLALSSQTSWVLSVSIYKCPSCCMCGQTVAFTFSDIAVCFFLTYNARASQSLLWAVHHNFLHKCVCLYLMITSFFVFHCLSSKLWSHISTLSASLPLFAFTLQELTFTKSGPVIRFSAYCNIPV